MKAIPLTACSAILLLVSCSLTEMPVSSAPPAWINAPANGTALQAEWWKAYGDPELDNLIERGWAANPEIEAALQRVEAAKADRFESMAALFPKAGVAIGFREGREQNRMTGYRPDDMEPWTATGDLSWEIDLFGKRRAGIKSAQAAEASAHANWRGVRLMIATEIAMARFEELLLGEEIALQTEQVASEQKAAGLNEELFRQGLISSSERADAVSTVEQARRSLSELDRQRGLVRLRLTRLCGGDAGSPSSSRVMPRIPASPSKSPASVWGSRPDLIAAEADVRSAFAGADAARLDLLPTLALGAGGNLGTNSLKEQLRTWELSAGPRLEIPIWDPARIAATKRGSAKASEAAANYRATALRAVEEIEGAFLNLTRRKGQLTSMQSEVESTRTSWLHSQAKSREGQGSFAQENQAARRYTDAARSSIRLHLQALDNHLSLVRALGG